MPRLTDALHLPCGAVLANRVAKPAATEGLADHHGRPTVALEHLYAQWANGGFGLLVSGNIIVDGRHLERPGNVVIEPDPPRELLSRLRSWTRVGTRNRTHFWAQLSHSGRQTLRSVNRHPMSPSAVTVGLPGGLFGKPQEMTVSDIARVVGQFASAARICKLTGFTGVQIHAAHGYLISSFLSPNANRRPDRWGGTLENRARLLLEIVAAVRAQVGPAFPISVKLNSADFQRGGFPPDESVAVACWLEAAGVDLLEISGGSYESPAMIGEAGGGAGVEAPPKKASTLAREAYFLDFARTLRGRTRMPILLTGGLRTGQGMQAALDEGVDMLGVVRPACVDPTCVRRLLAGEIDALDTWEEKIRAERGLFSSNSPLALIRTLASFSAIYWFYAQLYRLGRGQAPATGRKPIFAMLSVMMAERRLLAERQRLPLIPPAAPRPALGQARQA
jgi:2,4-dienoyl-CoA reductase-like NADH-dependent reductase (Old Yellow Enzyme family)